jgi:hypothetical protein
MIKLLYENKKEVVKERKIAMQVMLMFYASYTLIE